MKALILISVLIITGCVGEQTQPLSAKKPLGTPDANHLSAAIDVQATQIAELQNKACQQDARERLGLDIEQVTRLAPVWNQNRLQWQASAENENLLFGHISGFAKLRIQDMQDSRPITDKNWLITAYLYWWWGQCKPLDSIGTIDDLRAFIRQP